MSVSKGFLDNLDKVLIASDEKCVCDGNDCVCKSCDANELIEKIYLDVEDFIQKYGN